MYAKLEDMNPVKALLCTGLLISEELTFYTYYEWINFVWWVLSRVDIFVTFGIMLIDSELKPPKQ
jgi:hypothetical protein